MESQKEEYKFWQCINKSQNYFTNHMFLPFRLLCDKNQVSVSLQQKVTYWMFLYFISQTKSTHLFELHQPNYFVFLFRAMECDAMTVQTNYKHQPHHQQTKTKFVDPLVQPSSCLPRLYFQHCLAHYTNWIFLLFYSERFMCCTEQSLNKLQWR